MLGFRYINISTCVCVVVYTRPASTIPLRLRLCHDRYLSLCVYRNHIHTRVCSFARALCVSEIYRKINTKCVYTGANTAAPIRKTQLTKHRANSAQFFCYNTQQLVKRTHAKTHTQTHTKITHNHHTTAKIKNRNHIVNL